jgi:signal transduction histidine kinase
MRERTPMNWSLRRQALAVTLSSVGVIAALGFSQWQAVQAARERMLERASREARLMALDPSWSCCRMGEVHTGVGAPPAPGGAALGRRAVEESGALVEALQGWPEPRVVVARARHGEIEWWAIDLEEPQDFRRWFFGSLGAMGLLVAMAGLSIAGALGLRRSAGRLAADIASLESNLESPVATPAVTELRPVADRVRDLAAELRAALERQREAAESLAREERLAALGRVAAGLAHEVRNPLASMKLRVDLLLEGEVPQAARSDLQQLALELGRLDRLVGQMLAFVRGRLELRPARLSLRTLVDARLPGLRADAEAAGVTLSLSGAEVEAMGDADALARVVDNLVRNAVEASPRPGAVAVQVGAEPGTGFVEVVDEGPGVPPALLPRLFEPFATSRARGLGLGLALSRNLVESLQGRLEYRREGGRTVFKVSLPA